MWPANERDVNATFTVVPLIDHSAARHQ